VHTEELWTPMQESARRPVPSLIRGRFGPLGPGRLDSSGRPVVV